ncbi:unnamed protein product [Durusdinium trenchii]|uniref:Uncharacterized protein n=1 Tax=Durusdinium trenchii TaxID=1381693 RepID=A0ABP0R4W8_9DINO
MQLGAVHRGDYNEFLTPCVSFGDSLQASGFGQVPARRASFRLGVLLGHLAGGGHIDTSVLAMLPWPLRDALGQDMQVSEECRYDHLRSRREPHLHKRHVEGVFSILPALATSTTVENRYICTYIYIYLCIVLQVFC